MCSNNLKVITMSISPDIPEAGWIRTMREAAGISSYELARRAGVSQPTVINWERRERARTITLGSLLRAAEALDGELMYAITGRHTTEAGPRTKLRARKAAKPSTRPKPAPVTSSDPSHTQSIDPNSIWE